MCCVCLVHQRTTRNVFAVFGRQRGHCHVGGGGLGGGLVPFVPIPIVPFPIGPFVPIVPFPIFPFPIGPFVPVPFVTIVPFLIPSGIPLGFFPILMGPGSPLGLVFNKDDPADNFLSNTNVNKLQSID